MLDIARIDECFPKPQYRDGQRNCIEFAVNAFNSGKRMVILECPTGSGKSTMGMTMANMFNRSYYLTITKILQDQLINDFENVVDLKGKSAYPCTFYERYGEEFVKRKLLKRSELDEKYQKRPDCSAGFCRSSLNDGTKNTCSKCFLAQQPRTSLAKIQKGELQRLPDGHRYSACPYYEQVYKAIESRQVSMNFSSFLYQTTLTKRFQDTRDLLIIDEAHNIESQLLDFVSLSLNDSVLQKYNITIPNLTTAIEYLQWFDKIKFPDLIKQLIEIAEVNDKQREADDLERLLNKHDMFKAHVEKNGAEWVVERSEKSLKIPGHRETKTTVLNLKPVYVTDFAQSLLFRHAEKILLMSATILDVKVMCRSLGVDKNEVASYRMRNRFPVENRPIYIKPAARMTGGKDKMAEWMPKLVKSVEGIVEKYPGKRGIIHTHNFAIMEGLLNQCKPTVLRRLLTQKEFPDKRDMLNAHSKNIDSVIVAPAMHEGIDLVDDLSRFQIICKVPYANFYENKQLARRVEDDQHYYTWQTALKLIQSYGRSIRNEDDYADTYIIDATIDKFLRDAAGMMPSWFTEAIRR